MSVSFLLALMGGSLPDASTFAPRENALFKALLITSAVVLSVLAGLILTFLVRYRRGSTADRSPLRLATWKIETAWTVATTFAFLGFFFWGASLFLDMEDPPPGAAQISVIGRQWMWDIRYPSGRREFNALHVLVHQPVRLLLSSEDVIHSFFVPAFRLKQDVVAGKMVSAWFNPTQTGTFTLFCAQYCGSAHSEMVGRVIVLGRDDYARWVGSAAGGTEKPDSGREAFLRYGCSGCHDAGSSVPAPALAGLYGKPVRRLDGTFVQADAVYLHDVILEPGKAGIAGYNPVMPSYKGVLSEAVVAELITYVRSLPEAFPQAAYRSPP